MASQDDDRHESEHAANLGLIEVEQLDAASIKAATLKWALESPVVLVSRRLAGRDLYARVCALRDSSKATAGGEGVGEGEYNESMELSNAEAKEMEVSDTDIKAGTMAGSSFSIDDLLGEVAKETTADPHLSASIDDLLGSISTAAAAAPSASTKDSTGIGSSERATLVDLGIASDSEDSHESSKKDKDEDDDDVLSDKEGSISLGGGGGGDGDDDDDLYGDLGGEGGEDDEDDEDSKGDADAAAKSEGENIDDAQLLQKESIDDSVDAVKKENGSSSLSSSEISNATRVPAGSSASLSSTESHADVNTQSAVRSSVLAAGSSDEPLEERLLRLRKTLGTAPTLPIVPYFLQVG
jgi:hypothetical protein